MERLSPQSSSGTKVTIRRPSFQKSQPVSANPLPPIHKIILRFNIQFEYNHFVVAVEGTPATLEMQHRTEKVLFSTRELPVCMFNHGGGGGGAALALQRVLSQEFERERISINPTALADEIRRLWVGVRDRANASGMFGKRFPLDIDVTLWRSVVVHDRQQPSVDEGMVPASDTAINEMLKRMTMEEGDESCCVICLEEMKSGGLSKMPCAHVFHEECIRKWLKKSHYCPTCRFQMPTD